jgi:hypothetical protein
MRFLCVCDGGNVRSQALAYVLHDLEGQEAIAVGRIRVSKETMEYMCNWADRIVIMQPHMIESIPDISHDKVVCCDVGVDRFGIYIHPELLEMAKEGASWLLENFNENK